MKHQLMVFMGRGFTSGGQESASLFSAAVCKIQASEWVLRWVLTISAER